MPLEDDYRTLTEGAALVRGDDRARIAVSGGDRRSYLQGLLTNDIEALAPGTGCYAAWLTPQGRMTTDMHVLESGDMILLDVPRTVGESVLQRLEQFIFTEDVQTRDLTDSLAGIAVHGPAAAAAVAGAVGRPVADWSPYCNARMDFGGTPVVVARIDQLAVPGYVLYVEAARAGDLLSALELAGARAVSRAALDAARIEAGYPLFGVDMDDDIIPLEAGIEARAISFSKGCYVGQEVIIRVLHRGHGRVARRLVGLRLDDAGTIPERGARVHAGSKDVGFVTSGARSPRLGVIALAYVHRESTAPGTGVEAEVAGGRARATVSGLPFA